MDSYEETRLLVAFSDPSAAAADDTGRFLQLRHPKTGDRTCYVLINGGLQELNWFKQSYGSWFMGDYISEDGGLYAATPVDPVFILLPIFDEARMKSGDDQGKFRQLEEIIYLHDYPGYRYLSTIAEKSMETVCDCKVIGSTKFFRLNDSKVLAWMFCKVQQLKQTLVKLDKNYAARSQKQLLADAVMILAEYLADDPWYKLLCNNLRLNMLEAPYMEIEKSIATSFNPTAQQPTGSNKRVIQKGKKQNKKANVEMNSHNIRDMFSRASRRER